LIVVPARAEPDEMRRDWQEHREELLSFWRSGKTVSEAIGGH
jgi:hypothetical protein